MSALTNNRLASCLPGGDADEWVLFDAAPRIRSVAATALGLLLGNGAGGVDMDGDNVFEQQTPLQILMDRGIVKGLACLLAETSDSGAFQDMGGLLGARGEREQAN